MAAEALNFEVFLKSLESKRLAPSVRSLRCGAERERNALDRRMLSPFESRALGQCTPPATLRS